MVGSNTKIKLIASDYVGDELCRIGAFCFQVGIWRENVARFGQASNPKLDKKAEAVCTVKVKTSKYSASALGLLRFSYIALFYDVAAIVFFICNEKSSGRE